MIDRRELLSDLRRQLRLLERDLAARADSVPEMAAALQAEYQAARAAERTAATFRVWRAGELTQAAVAWLLGAVFVRFIEDNGLIDEPLIGGPHRAIEQASDRQLRYFRSHPTATDRDYLLHGFAAVARLPALAMLYDRAHNPVWRLGISGDAARGLLEFWRTVNPDTGVLRHDFTDPEWDTRFLGDLYQDLSDDAKKRYALLQTPEFVEEFILERTLTPALEQFGLAAVRLIDPACGSGHFLLGAFQRLLRRWRAREPEAPKQELAQRALTAVHGVDVNPFAAAIARFRLLVAALRASGIRRLQEAPAFPLNVAAGDSLLHGRRFGELDLGSGAEQHALTGQAEFAHAFQSEDIGALNRILGRQYHVVVGNPPYITVKDKAVNQLYRARYSTCHMKYALSVPFAERLFELAIRDDDAAGYVGQITSNSFMKREFGRKLIERLMPSVDLTHVIDTSGAYIPGHGTPTVILIGRNRAPASETVRAALGVRGEPEPPTDPANGKVWTAVVDQIDLPESESEWMSVSDVYRNIFYDHPWSISGGIARELQRELESKSPQVLDDIVTDVGITAVTGEDGLFIIGDDTMAARRLGVEQVRPLVIGDNVRDWTAGGLIAVWPYGENFRLLDLNDMPGIARLFWSYRTSISSRKRFGTPMLEKGLSWYEYQELYSKKLRSKLCVTFAFVATHNHFVLDRGGKVFNRSAPVIKLPDDATEADHLALVGLLNSSVACFWLQQVCHSKGGPGGAYSKDEKWHDFYEFGSRILKNLPVPKGAPLHTSAILDGIATKRQSHLPAQLTDRFPLTPEELDAHCDAAASLQARMIALQEELDWECYRLYGLIDEDFRYSAGNGNGDRSEPPPLALGERAFEIVMARRMVAGELETRWFERHGSTPITEAPAHWPEDYRALVARRIELIGSDRFVGLLERPEYKRRWNTEPWEDQERRALRAWLLDRLESPAYWPEPRLTTVRELVARAAADADFQQVAARFSYRAYGDLEALVGELVEAESVPALPALRYKPSGLAKRADWEAVWAAQRREDEIDAETAAATPRLAGETEDQHAARLKAEQHRRKRDELGDLAPPPKYRAADFLKAGYWRLRGALDVPKERFFSLPGVSGDDDPTLLVGRAGWDHLTLCQALAAYYNEADERDGWTAARAAPLLAAIREHVPWLKQWHNDLDEEFQQRLGDVYDSFVRSQLARFRLTEHDLRHWAPPGRS